MSFRDRGFKSIVIVAGLLVLAWACNPNPQPVGLTPIPTLAPRPEATLAPALQVSAAGSNAPAGPADAAAGAAVYFENCTTCHGLQAEGITGPHLRNNKFIQTGPDQAVADVIGGGRAGTEMPAWLQANGGALTSAQIADVIAYLHSLQNVTPLPSATPEPTETPGPTDTPGPTPEPARPSNEGEPGKAAGLAGNVDRGRTAFGQYCAACHGPQGKAGRPNPDSDDGAVPGINPIDPTIANADPKVFASNVDLYIEHGSVPAGEKPQLMMPAFGDGKLLTDQQIADIIAYVMSLNSGQ